MWLRHHILHNILTSGNLRGRRLGFWAPQPAFPYQPDKHIDRWLHIKKNILQNWATKYWTLAIDCIWSSYLIFVCVWNNWCVETPHNRILVSRKFLVLNKRRNIFYITEKKAPFLVQNKNVKNGFCVAPLTLQAELLTVNL